MGESRTKETYTHGHAPATVSQHARRTAAEAAAFLIPQLRPGMRLLDVGCGPGSITRGLAGHVAPGEVVGIDLSAETLASASRDAEARGLANLRYENASVYELPFDDASFDVVYAHQVLQHLRDPESALAEMLRVLRPDGWIAVREVDWGTVTYWPGDPWIDRFVEVHLATWTRNGGDPKFGRRLRGLFHDAGVGDLRVTAAPWCYATTEETTDWGESYAERILTSSMGERAVEFGYATRPDLEAMAAAFRTWSARPEAFWCFTQVAALARKAGDRPEPEPSGPRPGFC